jgi:hypothetical protein
VCRANAARNIRFSGFVLLLLLAGSLLAIPALAQEQAPTVTVGNATGSATTGTQGILDAQGAQQQQEEPFATVRVGETLAIPFEITSSSTQDVVLEVFFPQSFTIDSAEVAGGAGECVVDSNTVTCTVLAVAGQPTSGRIVVTPRAVGDFRVPFRATFPETGEVFEGSFLIRVLPAPAGGGGAGGGGAGGGEISQESDQEGESGQIEQSYEVS